MDLPGNGGRAPLTLALHRSDADVYLVAAARGPLHSVGQSTRLRRIGATMLTLHGIGTAVPAHSITQKQAAELARAFCGVGDQQTRLLPVLYRRAGVVTRGSVLLEGEENPQRQSFFL